MLLTSLSKLKIFYFLSGFLQIFGQEVEIVELKIPQYVASGGDVTMTCKYDTAVKIYSIKWYRNGEEFFSYVPSMNPKIRTFAIPGIIIDASNSNGTQIRLQRVSVKTEGRFKCEISAEWPNYNTVDRSGDMTVVVTPKLKPKISGTNRQYRLGDEVTLTCMSAPSKPKSELRWFFNGVEAPKGSWSELDTIYLPKKRQQTRSSLTFTVIRKHFIDGKLLIKCTSCLAPDARNIWHTTQREIIFNIPKMQRNIGDALSGAARTSVTNLSFNSLSFTNTAPIFLILTLILRSNP